MAVEEVYTKIEKVGKSLNKVNEFIKKNGNVLSLSGTNKLNADS